MGVTPPLQLASLSAYLKKNIPNLKIELIDGEMLSVTQICELITSEIIGISCNTLSYQSAILIAKFAKSKGIITVLGGTHPSLVGYNIVRNNNYFDYVISGDGEEALFNIILGKDLNDIPNLIYKSENRIVRNPTQDFPLNSLPIADYSGIVLEPYFSNYKKLYPEKASKKQFASYSAKGCQWRDRSGGGCIFCSIQHSGFRIKNTSEYWNELVHLNKEYGADFFWDVSDTFTSQKDWILEFAKVKPRNTDFNFQVYGRVNDINEELIEALKITGVNEVFLGLESGSNLILKNSRKGSSKNQNLKAIKNLARAQIKSVISIVVGLPGESFETVNETRSMIEDIIDLTELSEINISLVLPLPGTKMMQMIDEKLNFQLRNDDNFDAMKLRKLWFNNFTKLNYEDLILIQKEFSKYNGRVGTFGLTTSELKTNEQLTLH